MKILVSIIVICYKQAHYLDLALRSVLNQTYEYWECIIINDGSPDNTEELAIEWCEKDTRFKYVNKVNGGPSSARNAGIEKSKGEFIVTLDADDYIVIDYLERLVPELEQDDSLAIISCYSKFFENNFENIVYELKPNGTNYHNLLYVNQLIVTSLYRKKCWVEVGGYDEDMKKGFEDWEFWLNITKRGWNYKIVEDFLFFYRKAKKSRQVDVIANHFDDTRAYIFKKHKEVYIADFDNCMAVLFFELNRLRENEQKIKNSLDYKIAQTICKPYRFIQRILCFKKQ